MTSEQSFLKEWSCCGLDAGVGSSGGNAGLDEDGRADEVNDEGVEDRCGEEADEIPVRATDPEPAKVCFSSNKGAKAAARNKDDGDCAITSRRICCLRPLIKQSSKADSSSPSPYQSSNSVPQLC